MTKKTAREINYIGWLRNALQFIREQKLETDFRDWCGGWPCPVQPGPNNSLIPIPAGSEVTVPRGTLQAAVLALRSYECGNSAPALAGAVASQLEIFTGPSPLPAPAGEQTVPQNSDEILVALIGDLGDLNIGADPRLAARQLQGALAAAMALRTMTKRSQQS